MGKKKGPQGLRFDPVVITSRIKRRVEASEIPAKALYDLLGIEKWVWSKKINFNESSFNYREISILADTLDAPVGWPFIDDDWAEDFQAYMDRRKKGQD